MSVLKRMLMGAKPQEFLSVTCKIIPQSSSSPTKICHTTNGIRQIKIDGIGLSSVSTGYTFATLTEHTVEYILPGKEIPSSAFTMCTQITNVEIESGITSIGTYAFYQCSGITSSLVIPGSVTGIGSSAFYQCYGIPSIELPDSVKRIDSYVFYNCKNIKGELILPKNLTTLGGYAFYQCSGIRGAIKIPDLITVINDSVFYGCANITGVTFGKSLKTISSYAFSCCSNIKAITIPDSVNTIGTNGFSKTTDVTSIEIGSGVTSIGDYAFEGCSGVTSITCRAQTAPTIRMYTFRNIAKHGILYHPEGSDYSEWLRSDSYYLGYYKWLSNNDHYIIKTTYVSDSENTELQVYSSKSDAITLLKIDGVPALPQYGLTMKMPLGTHTVEYFISQPVIPYNCFYGCDMSSVIIPDGITTLEENSFYACKIDDFIKIGSGVTSIHNKALSNAAPKFIEVDSRNTYYDSRDNCNCLIETSSGVLLKGGGNAFIPDGVTSINAEAFTTAYDLEGKLVIPDSVKTIGKNAFYFCKNITSLEIGSGVTNISDYAFSYCSSLSSITCHAPIAPTIGSLTFYGVTFGGELIYPEGSDYSEWLRSDSYYLGSYNWNIDTPSIRTKVYAEYDGQYCKITPNNSPEFTTLLAVSINGLKFSRQNNNNALYPYLKAGENIVEYYFSGTTIPTGMFESMAMFELEIPDTFTSIGDDAFYNCTSLSSTVVIPDSVTSIGYRSFGRCTSLKSIKLGNGITTIGSNAFAYNYNMESIEIGSGVTTIGDYAFSGCTSLSSIICHAQAAPTVASRTFYNISQYGTLYHPQGTNYNSWLTTNAYYLGYYKWYSLDTNSTFLVPELNGYDIAVLTIPSNKDTLNLCNLTTDIAEIEVDGTVLSYPTTTTTSFNNELKQHIIRYKFKQNAQLNEVFYRNWDIITATISNNLTKIGDSMFSVCPNLKTVVLPNSLQTIGNYAFKVCSGITGTLVIPDSVKSIGDGAFSQCNNITSIEIGSGVTSIGDDAFYTDKSRLQTISVNNQNTYYDSRNNCNCLIETSSGRILKGSLTATIPNTVNHIGKKAFNYLQISSLNIPNSIISIEDYAFAYCSGITGTLVIPDSVKSIGDYAFRECSGLGGIDIGSGVTSIGKYAFANCTNITDQLLLPNSLQTIGDGAFEYLKINGKVVIPNSVQSIGTHTFYSCKNLTSVIIGSGVTSIGNYAFGVCTSLKAIEISSGITSIGNAAFSSCSGLSCIICHSAIAPTIENTTFSGVAPKGTLMYPEGSDYSEWLRGDSYYLGSYNWNDTIIKPNPIVKTIVNVTDITSPVQLYSHFDGCFKDIQINGTSIKQTSSYNFDTIGTYNVDYVLYGNTIYDYSFKDCTSFQSVEIGEGITTIGKHAFYGCFRIKNLTIGPDVKTINTYAFYHTRGLTCPIIIPDSVETIEGYAFSNWGGRSESLVPYIEIGSGVTSIGSNAFYERGVKKIICHAPIAPTIENTTFEGVATNGTLIYPEGSDYSEWLRGDSGYLGYYNWNNPVEIPKIKTVFTTTETPQLCKILNATGTTFVMLIDGVQYTHSTFNAKTGHTFTTPGEHIIEYEVSGNTIPSNMFNSCMNLTSVVIPEGISSIPTGAFAYCSNLVHVTLPSTIQSIENIAFKSCDSLASDLVLPENLTTVGASAFTDCYSVQTLTLGPNIRSIENSAFYNCSNLSLITCHAQVAPVIQNSSFYGVPYYGSLYHPPVTSYEAWMNGNSYYLGYYKWKNFKMFEPQVYYNLQITADNVSARATSTTIYWQCYADGYNTITNEAVSGILLNGTSVSHSFEQNTSETNTVERVITFEYQGLTATTTIIQDVWKPQTYEIDLNNQWQISSVANPNSGLYDGVYESFSNTGKSYSAALMYIDIKGYDNFKLYVRSYGENNYDYVVVSNLDCTLSSGTTTGANVKFTTSGLTNSNTTIDNYKLVEFTNIDGGPHRITVMYRKDSSGNSGTDKGYVLIPKSQ